MQKTYARLAGALLIGGYFLHCAFTKTGWHFIDNANLIFHEAGHAIFFFFGQFVQVAMGSGLQILLPLSIAGYFFYHRQRYEGALTLMWAGQNMVNVSVYAGDAIAMQLPLLGGDSVIHDWNYILNSLHALALTPYVAQVIYGTGTLTILTGFAASLYFAWMPRAAVGNATAKKKETKRSRKGTAGAARRPECPFEPEDWPG